MRYVYFREQLQNFVVFSLNDVRKIDPDFHRPQLNLWQKKGYIRKLRRGFYMFSDIPLNEEALFLIANRIYPPSYVSFESALSYHGLIPEGVYSITSASTKKTASFKTPITNFAYRRIKTSLYFGYRLERQNGQSYKIADMEKAVLDYLYLHPTITNEADFHEWRFNGTEFMAKVDISKLRRYARVFNNKTLVRRLQKLLTLIKMSE